MSLTIVTSHWKEDLTFLTKSKFPVVLIDKEGADPSPFHPQHIIPNVGNESTSYLKYIIENYDNLPDHIAFIHGHETAHHHKHDRPLLEVIEGANIEKYGFIPINNMHRASSFFNEVYIDKSTENPRVIPIRLYKFFDSLFIPCRGGQPLYDGPWAHDLGAQFIVSRERILANPKKLYEGWYYISTTNLEFTEEFGYILEKCWHVIFGESPAHAPVRDWFSFDWTAKLSHGDLTLNIW